MAMIRPIIIQILSLMRVFFQFVKQTVDQRQLSTGVPLRFLFPSPIWIYLKN